MASIEMCRTPEIGASVNAFYGRKGGETVIVTLPSGAQQQFDGSWNEPGTRTVLVAGFWRQRLTAIRSKDGALLASSPESPSQRYESARGTAVFLCACSALLGIIWIALGLRRARSEQ
jgi:hypothetical protein